MWSPEPTSLTQSLTRNTINWMSQPYRLADALARVCNHLVVDLQFQGMGHYVEGEQALLDHNEPECYIREVFLKGDDVNLCFARTVMPVTTYQGYQKEFDTLSAKLLGNNLLYSKNGGVVRSAFQYAVIDVSHPYFIKCKLATSHKLGARASVFYIAGQHPLLVTEIFLPNIPVYKAEADCETAYSVTQGL